MTGAAQNFARKYGLPIDHVGYQFRIIDKTVDEIEKGPEDGVYVQGGLPFSVAVKKSTQKWLQFFAFYWNIVHNFL